MYFCSLNSPNMKNENDCSFDELRAAIEADRNDEAVTEEDIDIFDPI